MNVLVVYGEQGCGKTVNALKIAKAFGMFHIVDDGVFTVLNGDGDVYIAQHYDFTKEKLSELPDNTLVLTSDEGFECAVHYDSVMSAIL